MTNFEGDERHRLKLMVTQTGAKYTGYLTRANSVLVAKQLVMILADSLCCCHKHFLISLHVIKMPELLTKTSIDVRNIYLNIK